MSGGRRGTPYHCPFCAEEDLRPVEQPDDAWVCRACARVFTVSFLRMDAGSLPGAPQATVAARATTTAPLAAAEHVTGGVR